MQIGFVPPAGGGARRQQEDCGVLGDEQWWLDGDVSHRLAEHSQELARRVLSPVAYSHHRQVVG